MERSKRWIFLTTALLVCISMTSIGRASPATVVAVDPQEVEDLKAGQSFTVDVTVADVTDLYSWDVNMTFNPAVLNVENVTEGPFLQQFNETVTLPIRIDNDKGSVFFGGVFKPPVPENLATGSGVLATITFTVEGYGQSDLKLESSNFLTVIGVTPWQIEHETEDGVFRNESPSMLSIELIIGIVVVVAVGCIVALLYVRRRRGTTSET